MTALVTMLFVLMVGLGGALLAAVRQFPTRRS